MKKTGFQKNLLVIGCAFLLIAALTFGILLVTARTYHFYVPETYMTYENISVEFETQGVVEVVSIEHGDNGFDVTLHALQRGETAVDAVCPHKEDPSLKDHFHNALYVTAFHTILEYGNISFNGLYVLCGAMAVFFLFAGVYLFLGYRRRKKTDFFSYETVLHLGLSLFFLMQGLLFSALLGFWVVLPEEANGWMLFVTAQYALTVMVFGLLPFAALLAGGLTVSNIWLIRHEGLRRTNILGILLSVFLFIGVGVSVVLAALNSRLFSFDVKMAPLSAARTVVSALVLYFAAILFATMYCCVIAARRKPPLSQDYILILGCAIKKDGTLYPLIKGRADKAIAFYNLQKEKTGKAPVLMPSGGQGSDEVMAEGEAVRRYLLEQGIPETDILAETKSKNTLENMRCSKALIDARTENASVIFSTTNYHVFRSGILANDAGLHADGIAGKTKWYFWPNAQIREFVGLLSRSWKLHLVLILLLVVFSLSFSGMGTLIQFILN